MTIVALVPSRRAAIATACAWLPDENAMTPRARSSSGSDEILLYAPRNLNAPPRWKDSAFRCTDAPTSASSVRDETTGVLLATPASRSAAARTSSSSINMLASMPLWDSLSGLSVRIDDVAVQRRELPRDEWTRVTTTVVLTGDDATGEGEDVTYDAAAHDDFPAD